VVWCCFELLFCVFVVLVFRCSKYCFVIHNIFIN
jgi:hypothetical protein